MPPKVIADAAVAPTLPDIDLSQLPTAPDIEIRTSRRYCCARPPMIRVLSRPTYCPLILRVVNISQGGIGILSRLPLQVGDRLVLSWHYGPTPHWRNLLASVVHVTCRREGDWVAGCRFDAPMTESDLHAFLVDVNGTPRG